MIVATAMDQIADLVASDTLTVFFFTADWCPDCQYIYPDMPDITLMFPQARFVRVDRDAFLELAAKWDVYGIPSFVVTKNAIELGRLVNKSRKSKEEIIRFLTSVC